MRQDFNKLLTENPRAGSGRSFKSERRSKVQTSVDEDGMPMHSGTKQSMRSAHSNRKDFNENLSPLKRFLQSRVGKQWDKTYSLIRSTFDTRKVINNHIMQHLFDYVETKAFLKDGKVVVLLPYRNVENSIVPIAEGMSDFYVDPRDGCLKANTRKKSYKQQQAVSAKKRAAEIFAKKRVLDKYNELHLVDGIWYHYILKERPPKVERLVMPQNLFGPHSITSWKQLTDAQKREVGTVMMVDVDIHEVTPPDYDTSRWAHTRGKPEVRERYYAERKTASKKLLKEHGLLGTAQERETDVLTRRELNKYKEAA